MRFIERIDRKPVAIAFGLRRGGAAQSSGGVTLAVTRSAESVSLVTPAGATPLPAATAEAAGVLGAADKAKLDGISGTGADAGMSAATYDPQGVGGDAFDRANHTGQQAISTVDGLLSALDGKATASHTHSASQIASGTIATARLGSGTANGATFLRGDGTWAAPAAAGNVSKIGTPVAKRVAYWTGDGTLGHEAGFAYDPATDTLAVAKIAIGGITLDGEQLTDPNAGRLLGWDDTNNTSIWYAAANGVELSGAKVQLTANQRTTAIEFVIDGGGSAITTGLKGCIEVPMACSIVAGRLLADQAGSIVVDVWKDSFANYPPTDADSITASAPLTVGGATKSEDATLAGWAKSIAAGDILGFNVDSASGVRCVTVVLVVTIA